MRRPIKSMRAGLTCVAAYIAPECANGRSSGSPSVPYPLEIARRVDHASNAAAPCPAAINEYQILRCRGDSTGRSTAGLMGAFKNGWLPGPIPSVEEEDEASASVPLEPATLGAGTSGSFDFVVETGWGALELLATRVGESAMAGGVSAGSAVQQNSTSADRTKIHLRSRRPGVGSWYAATPVHFTVLRDRCHWPIGHIFPWYFLWPPFWSLRTPRLHSPSRFGEKTCYNPAQEAVVLRFGGKWLVRNHRRNALASRNVARSHLDSSLLKALSASAKPRSPAFSPNVSMRAAFTIVKTIPFLLIFMPAFPAPLSALRCTS